MFPKVILLGVVLLFVSLSLSGYANPGNPVAFWLFAAGFTSGLVSLMGGINMRRCPTSLWHSLATHWWAQYCPICGEPLGDRSTETKVQRPGAEWDEEKAIEEDEGR